MGLPIDARRLILGGVMFAWAAGFVLPSTAMAANKKDPNREAIRRLQMQIKQAEDAKAGIEQEKTALASELEALKKKASDLERGSARAHALGAKLEKELEATRTELSDKLHASETKLADTQRTLADTHRDLQRTQVERQRLESALTAKTRFAETCESNNRKLYRYHVELINHAQSQGSFDALLSAEPFTQIKRVEIENILEEYRDKIDAVQVGTTTRAVPDSPQ